MDPIQISCLAKLLRDSGDKVLNANFKLTLSGPLLRALNDSFSLIADQHEICAPQSFQVVKPNNSISDVFRDLQFIHDFVQKTRILSVTRLHNDEPFENTVDISKFRNLIKLEIQRVPIHLVTGIQQMRAHLQEIKCVRSINCVKDIISHCGGDKSNGFIWNELKSADFSYNTLTAIDCSLEFAQWLQHLNLSHNHIVSVDAIKWLPNLKVLNLSFNRLIYVPLFHMEASKRLQILNLTNNFIEDVSEISRLDALNELDLSENCLLDHSTLLPLSTLIALHYLNLEGNPLSCHPKHRQATARYLHKNTTTVKFILDSAPLSKAEKDLTGNYQSYNLILTSRVSIGSFGKRSSGQQTPARWTKDNTPTSSVGSVRSLRSDGVKNHDDMHSSIITQKKVKARRALIADDIEETKVQQSIMVTSLESNKEHLETRKQIEELRNRYGDGWLLNHGEHMDQNIKLNKPYDEESTSSEKIIESFLETIAKEEAKTLLLLESQPILPSSTPIQPISVCDNELQTDKNITTDNIENISINNNIDSNVESDTKDIDIEYDYLNGIYAQLNTTDVVSDPEDNEVTYIVNLEPLDDEIFLIVSDLSIKEKDIFTGKTTTKWSLKSLESCEQIKSDVLLLKFDTIKKDKKERTYKVEKGLCEKLEKFLRYNLSKKPLSEMNQTLYRCTICATQFSREHIYKKQNIDISCPECKRSYVIEIRESPRAQSIERVGQYFQQNKKSTEILEKKNLIENCESYSSIGSATSLNESSSCSKISKSESSFDSNQSVVGSSNCDRDANFSLKNGDSDIEILSNPSQSSIEVLDSFHSCRKQSEERRISQIPSLDTISDDSLLNNTQILAGASLTLVNQQTSTQDLLNVENSAKDSMDGDKKVILSEIHLTESSSSGSVTDSICTAYEQNRQIKSTETIVTDSKITNTNTSPEKTAKSDTSVITTMLGGLFQSTNLLMSRSQKSDSAFQPCERFKFSYTDFDNVDHRLKLYLYQNVFEDDSEHLKWLVKGKLLQDNKQSDENAAIFDGIFVMSTTKCYVFCINGKENDDISKWLKRQLSGTVDRVEIIRVMPWKIGITFTIKDIGNVHLFLQDIIRTDSLLLFFANNPLPNSCSLEYQISERLLQKLLKATDNTELKMLAILNACETSMDQHTNTQEFVGLIVTETNLYLFWTHRWIVTKIDVDIEIERNQLMSNLVDVEQIDEKSFRINYLDENQDKCEFWTCTFETESSAASTLNAISQSWEKLFSVPLGNI